MSGIRTIELEPIGYISTPFKSKPEAPHQPDPVVGVEGIVKLLPGHNYEQALEDLDSIEKIWLIYWFDRNPNWKPKVLVPRGPRVKRGVFATRSPHRPNPIGLSLVDLVCVEGLTLRVRNIDLLDGTPILDIKPYLPSVEAYPNANTGWIASAELAHQNPKYQIEYSELAMEQLTFLAGQEIALKPRIERVLIYDPNPHPYKRIEQSIDGFVQAIRGWRVYFKIIENSVTVTEIQTGYTEESFSTGEELADDKAQRMFRDAFRQVSA